MVVMTPAGPAPEPPPATETLTPAQLAEARRLMSLCGDLELLERDLSRALVELDALRRRVSALERRAPAPDAADAEPWTRE